MVYFSGDIHGNVRRVIADIRKYRITREDIIVLLGDVGLNYFGDKRDVRAKKLLNDQGVRILAVHGNHEMRPESIPGYHEREWHGGVVYVENDYPNLLFAKDGEVFDLEGLEALVIGGAYSVDKYYRLEMGFRWFADEQPSADTKTRVERRLEERDWKIDIVLSHTCPESYIPTEMFLPQIDQGTVDRSTEQWLGKLEGKMDYCAWLCGHWHTDKRADRMRFLFDGYTDSETLRRERDACRQAIAKR